MLADVLVYTLVVAVSVAVGSKCFSRGIVKNAHRSFHESSHETDRQIHDAGGSSLLELSLRIRDRNDPLVSEILEETRRIRERRRRLSFNRKRVGMQKDSALNPGIEKDSSPDDRSRSEGFQDHEHIK